MFKFDIIEEHGGHEQVVLCTNKDAGLKAIIAIHNTTLGPALGGTRMWTYKSDEDALIDVLRLSKGMTYKAAAAGLNLGGGKAVIIGDPKKDKSEALFRAFGRFIEGLNGRYFTAEDVGTDVNDMEFINMETQYVTGIDIGHGGSGDPSPFTAHGTLMGIKACIKEKMNTDSLKGLKVAVQGVGSVGKHLVELLHKEKAQIVITDTDKERVQAISSQYGCDAVSPEDIYSQNVDIFSPCALGAVINDDTINLLKCSIVAGGANNQLKDARHGDILKDKNILYAPDYVINAGGLMNVYLELEGYSHERALNMTRGIYYNLRKVFAIAKNENIPTYKAADRMAEERINKIGKVKQTFLGRSGRRFNNLVKVDSK
ncbi:MAG: Glu/Leu/Phe/Val dehydrogenase [Oligoflexia bacterium]|nr:Glu/Leu/Phe/Val dehydrogenase [Oligoflexia bacterium]